MTRFLLVFSFLISFCLSVHSQASGLADLKFGRYQIADSQWNVNACMNTTTCQIYSKNPGTAYKIPWTSGQIQWAAGDYIGFVDNAHKDANNPWLAVQYDSNSNAKTNMGTGHIINMGSDFFFFVGNDNDTGQLFSMTQGFANTSGVTWTGTRNPTQAEVNTYAQGGSTTPLAAGQTAAPAGPPPPLCCGGSAAPFTVYSTHVNRLTAFTNRTTADSQVNITQIGDDNIIAVTQLGTRNNRADIGLTGSNNNITVNQSGNASTVANYSETWVSGNNNHVSTTQQSTGGTKGSFVSVTDNNNALTIQQKDSGSHYASVNLSGGNKTVDILQQGSAGHMASVTLTGPQPASLNLIQSGSTQLYYSITNNCVTAGGCAPITVTQGK
jgi:hypothetical protein